jgi:hypothetical protein
MSKERIKGKCADIGFPLLVECMNSFKLGNLGGQTAKDTADSRSTAANKHWGVVLLLFLSFSLFFLMYSILIYFLFICL